MTLEMMKELFGVTNIGEEEVSNVKCMHVGGRGGLTVIAYHYCGPTGGRGGPSTAGPRFRNLARGRGHSSPAAGSPCHGPIEGRSPTRPRYPCPTEGRGGPSPTAPPLLRSCQKEGDALLRLMTMASMMKALCRPW
jgi:hypothetical protein